MGIPYANTWFSADILIAYQAGIIGGVDSTGRCNVGTQMTRTEVCQMLYNADMGKARPVSDTVSSLPRISICNRKRHAHRPRRCLGTSGNRNRFSGVAMKEKSKSDDVRMMKESRQSREENKG